MGLELVTLLPPGAPSHTRLAKHGTRLVVLREIKDGTDCSWPPPSPGLVTLEEVGELQGKRHALFPWVPGVTLRDLVSTFERVDRPVPLGLLGRVVIDAARSVALAEPSRPHGGLQDASLQIGFDGQVWVLDHGAPRMTRFRPIGRVTHGGDVFALAGVVHSALTGFKGAYATPPSAMAAPSRSHPEATPQLDLFIERALLPPHEQRPKELNGFADGLEALIKPLLFTHLELRAAVTSAFEARIKLLQSLGGLTVQRPSLEAALPMKPISEATQPGVGPIDSLATTPPMGQSEGVEPTGREQAFDTTAPELPKPNLAFQPIPMSTQVDPPASGKLVMGDPDAVNAEGTSPRAELPPIEPTVPRASAGSLRELPANDGAATLPANAVVLREGPPLVPKGQAVVPPASLQLRPDEPAPDQTIAGRVELLRERPPPPSAETGPGRPAVVHEDSRPSWPTIPAVGPEMVPLDRGEEGAATRREGRGPVKVLKGRGKSGAAPEHSPEAASEGRWVWAAIVVLTILVVVLGYLVFERAPVRAPTLEIDGGLATVLVVDSGVEVEVDAGTTVNAAEVAADAGDDEEEAEVDAGAESSTSTDVTTPEKPPRGDKRRPKKRNRH